LKRRGSNKFGTSLVLPDEDVSLYNDLQQRIRALIAPENVIEEILVDDFIRRQWDLLRYERYKTRLLCLIALDALRDRRANPGPSVFPRPSDKAYDDCLTKFSDKILDEMMEEYLMDLVPADLETAGKDTRLLKLMSRTVDAHIAEAFASKPKPDKNEPLLIIERLDRLAAAAEKRRNAALYEIDRHRATLGKDLRRTLNIADKPKMPVVGTSTLAKNQNAKH